MKKRAVSIFSAVILVVSMICAGVVPAEELTSGDSGFWEDELLIPEEEGFAEELMAVDAGPEEAQQNPDLIEEENEEMLLPEGAGEEETGEAELLTEEELSGEVLAADPENELIPIEEETAEVTASGICGENLKWEISGTSLLIWGVGEMYDYQREWGNGGFATTAPWFPYRDQVEFISVGDSVTYVGSYAFAYMEKVTMAFAGDNIEAMGDCAYEHAAGLIEIAIPRTLKTIPQNTFLGCSSLARVTIREGVQVIGEAAFSNCYSLTGITIPPSVTSIEMGAFEHCSSLSMVNLSYGLSSIKAAAFECCFKLGSITIPDSVEFLGADAFRECTSLKTVKLPTQLKEIHGQLFYGCPALESVSIPDTVTKIEYMAFMKCSKLQKLSVPKSVKTLGTGAFIDSGLKEIFFFGNAPETEEPRDYLDDNGDMVLSYIFRGCTANGYYPAKNSTWTSSVRNSMGGNITWISWSPEGTSGKCGKNLNYTLSKDGLLTISGSGAMYDYSDTNAPPYTKHGIAIKRVVMNSGVTQIGKSAFANLGSLQEVIIPSTVKKILYRGFYGCNALKSISVPGSVWSIQEEAFADCKGLQAIALGKGVQSLGPRAFGGCTSLASVGLPVTLYEILSRCFENCRSITSIYLPDVEKISTRTFSGCSALEWITIPLTMKTIESYAFSGCTSLLKVDYAGTWLTWEDIKIASAGNENLLNANKNYHGKDGQTWNINSQPDVLSAVNEAGGIRIKWQSADAVPEYRVYRGVSDNNYENPDIVGFIDGDTTTFLDTTAVSGKTYRYHITTIRDFDNGLHESWEHDQANYGFKIIVRLGTPTVSSVENLRDGIAVRWNKVSGAASYRILRKEAREKTPLGSYGNAGAYSQVGSVVGETNLYFKDKTAEAGVKYTYTVRAAKGGTLGAYYNTGKTIVRLLVPSITRLDNNAAGIGVCWEPSTGATGYAVLRLEGKNWKTIAKVEGNKTTYYTDPEVKTGYDNVYTYSVRARRDGSVGSYSTVGKSLYRLKNTSITKLTNLPGKQVKVEWLKVGVADGYQIQCSPTKDFKVYTSVESPYKNTLQYVMKGFALNKLYYFRIRPYKNVNGVKNYGIYSGVKTISIKR